MPKGIYGYRGKKCSIDGCNNHNKANGLCDKHSHSRERRLAGIPERKRNICTIENCGKFVKACGLCSTHWQQKRRRELGIKEWTPRGVCSVDGCDKKQHAKKYCYNHYYIMKANGDPLILKRSPNGAGFTDLYGYRIISVNGKQKREHRHMMELKMGRELLKHENVHHINGDRDDNRIGNLELWSTKQPYGQRVDDKVNWAIEMLKLYKPEVLSQAIF